MDIRDSPLRGLLNSPVKRVTPAVPTPDWTASSVPQNVASPLTSPVISRYNVPSPVIRNTSRQSCIQTPGPLSSPDPNSLRSSVISCSPSTSLKRNHSDENYRPEDSSWYPPQNGEAESQSKQAFYPERLTHTPVQNRISGDVVLTPTHSAFTPSQPNPHQLMVPQTPIPSEPNQAKNSIKLQNCVSTVNLNCELKLLDVYCRTRFSEYNPSRFHGVVMRILNPRATALVFKSGKLVCTGARNEHDSLLATKKFARIIQKLGFPVRFTEFKIQNFVATADLRFPVRLEALQQSHGQFTSYEPELFPGLIYRMVRPRIVLLIFVNGKIVFTGAKSREDITESLTIIYPILRSFRKN